MTDYMYKHIYNPVESNHRDGPANPGPVKHRIRYLHYYNIIYVANPMKGNTVT